jgi:hypothetical protein
MVVHVSVLALGHFFYLLRPNLWRLRGAAQSNVLAGSPALTQKIVSA